MESNQIHNNRVATLRPSKWAAGSAALLLSATLLLGACSTSGSGTGTGTGTGTGSGSTTTTTPSVDSATAEATDDSMESMTPEAGATEDMMTPEAGATEGSMESMTPEAGATDMSGGEEITGTGTTTN